MLLSAIATLALTAPVNSDPSSRPQAPACTSMTDERLDAFLRRLDPEVLVRGRMRQLTLEDTVLLVVSDASAGRMRIMTPVAAAGALSKSQLERVLQANFDAVLDARYAVAQGKLWSVFIHPLGDLSPEELVSGLAQVVVAAKTYGSAYTSGALVFSGGDTGQLHRELYEELRKKGRSHI